MLTATDEAAESFDLASVEGAGATVGNGAIATTFRIETVSEQFRLDRMQTELMLALYPVVQIVSIVEGADTLAPSDYEVDLAKGLITRLINDRVCHWTRCKITVVYSAGYDELADVPPALQRAFLELVRAHFDADDQASAALRDGRGDRHQQLFQCRRCRAPLAADSLKPAVDVFPQITVDRNLGLLRESQLKRKGLPDSAKSERP
jgi:hypothetical protein